MILQVRVLVLNIIFSTSITTTTSNEAQINSSVHNLIKTQYPHNCITICTWHYETPRRVSNISTRLGSQLPAAIIDDTGTTSHNQQPNSLDQQYPLQHTSVLDATSQRRPVTTGLSMSLWRFRHRDRQPHRTWRRRPRHAGLHGSEQYISHWQSNLAW